MHTKALSRQALIAALTFGGFFLLGYGGIFAWGGNGHSSSPIWPATAFGFVMLIRLSRSRTDDAAILSRLLPLLRGNLRTVVSWIRCTIVRKGPSCGDCRPI